MASGLRHRRQAFLWVLPCFKVSRRSASMPRIAGHLCLWPPHCLPVLRRLQDAKAGAATSTVLRCARAVSLVQGRPALNASQIFCDPPMGGSVINMDSGAYLA